MTVRGTGKHGLNDVDTDARTAVCNTCGRVKIWKRGSWWKCSQAGAVEGWSHHDGDHRTPEQRRSAAYRLNARAVRRVAYAVVMGKLRTLTVAEVAAVTKLQGADLRRVCEKVELIVRGLEKRRAVIGVPRTDRPRSKPHRRGG